MPVSVGKRRSTSRNNRRLGLGLGLVAIFLYAAIAFRWTHGF